MRLVLSVILLMTCSPAFATDPPGSPLAIANANRAAKLAAIAARRAAIVAARPARIEAAKHLAHRNK